MGTSVDYGSLGGSDTVKASGVWFLNSLATAGVAQFYHGT